MRQPAVLMIVAIAVLLAACKGEGASTVKRPAKGKTMSQQSAHQHHAIDYIEFPVTDMARAKRFYAAAFGWSFNDYGPDYAGIKKEGGEAGGLKLEPKVQAGGPLVILYSQDLELSLKKVKEAGATIVKEPFSFPGGRRFQFRDPSGNELAVWAEK
jgi:uncharacterized protein